MENKQRVKELDKTIRKNAKDAITLKMLIEENKNKRETRGLIHQMIVRSETIWQCLRTIGQTLDEKKVKDDS